MRAGSAFVYLRSLLLESSYMPLKVSDCLELYRSSRRARLGILYYHLLDRNARGKSVNAFPIRPQVGDKIFSEIFTLYCFAMCCLQPRDTFVAPPSLSFAFFFDVPCQGGQAIKSYFFQCYATPCTLTVTTLLPQKRK